MSSGCFTLSNTVKPEVTPPGKLQFGLGAVTSDDGAMPIIDLRWGMAPRWDIGSRFDTFGQSLDTRVQFLTQEQNKVNGVIEAGIGVAIISVYEYAGIGFGVDLGRVSPYIHVRYLHSLVDRDEMQDDSNNFVEDLFLRLDDDLVNVVQFFLGLDIELGEKCSITPELLWVPELNDLFFINVALNFRLW